MHLICGMHRSGTSLIARLASHAGGDFGDETGFYPADKWNPDGYFEQKAIIRVNSQLVNGPWGRLSYLALPSTDTLLRRGHRHEREIRELARRYRARIVKENRFCLTLPVWRQFDADITKVVMVFRGPLAVAESLKRRNRLPLRLGFGIWEEHYRRLLRHIADIDAICIWYDRLVSDGNESVNQTRRLLRFLDLDEGRAPDPVAHCVRLSERFRPYAQSTGTRRIATVDSIYRQLIAMQDD